MSKNGTQLSYQFLFAEGRISPDGAEVIHNPRGTAPCFRCEQGDRTLICLPGVPFETEPLIVEEVLPFLQKKYSPGGRVWINRVLKIVGVGESNVDAQIKEIIRSSKNPIIGLQASPGETKVRLTAMAESRSEADRLLDDGEARVRDVLGDLIIGYGDENLPGVVADLLKERRLSLAMADAMTGGVAIAELGRRLNPGQLVGGLVIGRPGTAEDAAYEAEDRFRADVLLAVAGSPDDEGRTRVEILVRGKDGREAEKAQSLGGPHRLVMERAATLALYTLWRFLKA